MLQFKSKAAERSTQRQSGRRNFLLFPGGSAFLSYSGFQTDWLEPVHTGQGILLYSFFYIQMLMSSRNTLTDIPKIMFDQISEHRIAHKINHHTGKLCKLREKTDEINQKVRSTVFAKPGGQDSLNPLYSSEKSLEGSRGFSC